MRHFETPQPVSVSLDLTVAAIRLVATDRADTTVEVVPSNEAGKADVELARLTTVDLIDDALHVKSPKRWKAYTFLGDGSIDVVINLPTGSRVATRAWTADFRTEGTLGECSLKTSSGDVWIETAGALTVYTDGGDVTVERATGQANVTTQDGTIRVREIHGSATVKNGEGDIWIGEVTGDLKVNADNGDITVERALGNVTGKTADGDVRIGEVAQGEITVETADGDLEVGVPEGLTAWVDAKTQCGKVDTPLETFDEPLDTDRTVRIRARTADGDIVITRP